MAVMMAKIWGRIFGVDRERDRETLFLTLMLEFGPAVAYPFSDGATAFRFEEVALRHLPQRGERISGEALETIYCEYYNWYKGQTEAQRLPDPAQPGTPKHIF